MSAGENEARQRASVREVKSTSRNVVDLYTYYLFKPATKICLIILFAALFTVEGIFALKVTVDVDEKDLTPYNSQTDRFQKAFAEYFEQDDGLFRANIYYHDLDVSDPIVRQQMLDFRHDILGLGSDSYPPYPIFVADFEEFLTETQNETAASNKSFREQLDSFFNISTHQSLYGSSIIRDGKASGIASIKEGITIAREVSTSGAKIDFILLEQRDVTIAQPLNSDSLVRHSGAETERMFLFEIRFPMFEHLRILPKEIVMGLSLSLLAVGLVALIFTPHPTCVLLSVMVITMVDIEIVGVLVLSGGSIQTLSMVVLIMSIGLVADYCLHVMHAYLHVDSTTRTGRAKLAVENVGGSVLLGGMSTFLGVLALAFSSGKIFSDFFVLFSSMAALGVSHGLILLPVVLSYIGPENVAQKNILITCSSGQNKPALLVLEEEALENVDSTGSAQLVQDIDVMTNMTEPSTRGIPS